MTLAIYWEESESLDTQQPTLSTEDTVAADVERYVIEFDALVEDPFESEGKLTEHPIGYVGRKPRNVNTHVALSNLKKTIVGTITNLATKAYQQRSDGVNEPINPQVVDEEIGGFVQSVALFRDRISETQKNLDQLQSDRRLVQLETTEFFFEDMVIESYSFDYVGSINTANFSITLGKVNLVKVDEFLGTVSRATTAGSRSTKKVELNDETDPESGIRNYLDGLRGGTVSPFQSRQAEILRGRNDDPLDYGALNTDTGRFSETGI